jgi:hypothetical protein
VRINPIKKLSRRSDLVYSGDGTTASPQFGQRKLRRKIAREFSIGREHAGHVNEAIRKSPYLEALV